jgi:tRNA A37 methylthiotransferase MiaB
MKVLLASISFATPYQPQREFLALGYLHAYAQADPEIAARATIVHRTYDPALLGPEEIASRIAAEEPDLVAASCYVWNTPDVLRTMQALKRRRSQVRVLLGGPEVSYHYERVLRQHLQVDWIGVGEGELTFRELLRAELGLEGPAHEEIAGLGQRRVRTPFLPAPRPYLADLDQLPSPYLSGVMDLDPVRQGALYQTARGCPFVCSFCDYGRNQPYHEFSLARVRAELEHFARRGAKVLFNVDPTFNYRKHRAAELLQLAIDLDLRALHWIEIFPTLLDDELTSLLERSPLVFLGVGIQTTNPRSMRAVRRVWQPDKVAPLLDRLQGRPNVITSYEMIMGLPDDTLQDFKDTLSWTYARRPADLKSFNLAILPRTPLESEVERYRIEFDPEVGHEVLATSTMTRDEVARGKAINDWHRLFQSLFLRLTRWIARPAAEVIEDWAFRAHDLGYSRAEIEALHTHRIEPAVVEELAQLWQRFVADHCEAEHRVDVSAFAREQLRYHLYRRRRTWTSAFLADVRDLYFGEPYAALHRVDLVKAAAVPEVARRPFAPDVAERAPWLPSDVDLRAFAFDLNDLHRTLAREAVERLAPRAVQALLFTDPRTGAARVLEVDEATIAFVERLDGRRTLRDIQRELEALFGPRTAAALPALRRQLEREGLFTPQSYAESSAAIGRATWRSAFPEAHRSYH